MTAAVIFDLDGVLIDSEPVWERVRHDLVVGAGGSWPADAQRRLMGMSTTEWAHYLSSELGTGLTAEETARTVIDRMREEYRRQLPLLPDAVETVRRTAERWPLGLASSSPRELIETVLRSAGLAGVFRAVVSADEVAKGKPDPDIYLTACRSLGVAAAECAAVEDSSNGIRAAYAAGLRVLAVPRPQYPVEEDAQRLAAVVLTGLAAVPDALSR